MYRVYEDAVSVVIPVILEEGDHNWSAFAPSVPGCITTGKDRADTLKNMREALEFNFNSTHRDELAETYAAATPELAELSATANATLTIEEAAQAVGSGVSAITGAVRRGELIGIVEADERRSGRRRVRRVYRQELERWAAAHAGQAARKPRRVRSA